MYYTTMNKPSKNMLLSNTELAKMVREQEQEIYEADNAKSISEQAALNRDMQEYSSYINDYIAGQSASINNRVSFLQTVKEAFITECIMKLYTESLDSMDSRDKVVARNLVTRFVKENGAGDLIRSFSTKNLLLSEMARISQKYYDKVVESCNSENCDNGTKIKDYSLDTTIKDDFFKEMEDIDMSEASKLIKDRVSESIQQFIDDNSYAKMEYQDVIQSAQDSISNIKTTDEVQKEALIEEYTSKAKRKINEMRLTRSKNIFSIMVESLTHKALSDNSYKTRYVHESTVNMNKVVEDTTLIYTMLEMVNTTNMIKVDEQFINNYLLTLK